MYTHAMLYNTFPFEDCQVHARDDLYIAKILQRIQSLQTENTTPFLSVRIHDQCSNEKTDGDTNGRLDHSVAKGGEGAFRGSTGGAVDIAVGDSLSIRQTRNDGATRRQAGWHQSKDTWDDGGSRMPMP